MPLISKFLSRISPGLLRTIRCRVFMDLPRLHRLLPAQGRVLEIGCGYGHVLSCLAEARSDLEFSGVDPDTAAIVKANSLWQRPNLRFAVGTAADTAGEYEAILVLHVLHHLPAGGERELLAHAATRLNRNGNLILEDLWPGHDGFGIFLDTHVSRCPPLVRTEAEIEAALAGCGLRIRGRIHYKKFFIGRILLTAGAG